MSRPILTWALRRYFLNARPLYSATWMDHHNLLGAQCNLGEPVGWNFLKATPHLDESTRFLFFFFTFYSSHFFIRRMETSWEGGRRENGEMKRARFTLCGVNLARYYVPWVMHKPDLWLQTKHVVEQEKKVPMLVMRTLWPWGGIEQKETELS